MLELCTAQNGRSLQATFGTFTCIESRSGAHKLPAAWQQLARHRSWDLLVARVLPVSLKI